MTDDIVTRLQMFSLDDGTDALNKLLAEAADEIEHLRKQRDYLAWAIAWFLNGGSREKLERRFKEYEATL